jgi:hypothetical protein
MRVAFAPKNDRLKEFIKYISFYAPEKELRQFLVFPNPGSAISLYRQHTYYPKEPNVYCTLPTEGKDTEMLQVNRIDPVKVIDEESREVVTIVFHPLGVNHFITTSLSELVGKNGDYSFIPLSGFDKYIKIIVLRIRS